MNNAADNMIAIVAAGVILLLYVWVSVLIAFFKPSFKHLACRILRHRMMPGDPNIIGSTGKCSRCGDIWIDEQVVKARYNAISDEAEQKNLAAGLTQYGKRLDTPETEVDVIHELEHTRGADGAD